MVSIRGYEHCVEGNNIRIFPLGTGYYDGTFKRFDQGDVIFVHEGDSEEVRVSSSRILEIWAQPAK